MDPIEDATLRRIVAQLASYPWRDAEIAELVAPKFGIITGFQALLAELESLRAADLEDLPPAGPIRPAKPR